MGVLRRANPEELSSTTNLGEETVFVTCSG